MYCDFIFEVIKLKKKMISMIYCLCSTSEKKLKACQIFLPIKTASIKPLDASLVLHWVTRSARVVLGTSCLGYDLSWVRVVLGTSCPGQDSSWVRVVLVTSCPSSVLPLFIFSEWCPSLLRTVRSGYVQTLVYFIWDSRHYNNSRSRSPRHYFNRFTFTGLLHINRHTN